MEYRFNFFTDVVFQPILTSGVEMLVWLAVFKGLTTDNIGGFGLGSYLSYSLWAAFVARISTNWMYEYRMIQEIDKGTINAILVRPISFFEFYLSQFMGYKFVTTTFSIPIVVFFQYWINETINLDRLPLALCLIFYYVLFSHLLSFVISTLAFRFNRIYSITGAKNLLLWLLTGELIPLDLFPPSYKAVLLALPFCNAVYIPVAYITGRIDLTVVLHGFASLSLALIAFGGLAYWCWTSGIRKYAGTGA